MILTKWDKLNIACAIGIVLVLIFFAGTMVGKAVANTPSPPSPQDYAMNCIAKTYKIQQCTH